MRRRHRPRIDYLGSVREFHLAFGVEAPEAPTAHVDDALRTSRKALMEEELHELVDAMAAEDLLEIADGLADLLYVVFGTGVAYGIPIDEIFEEVHSSNMSKLGADGKPIIGENGKRLRGPRYRPPNISPLLS